MLHGGRYRDIKTSTLSFSEVTVTRNEIVRFQIVKEIVVTWQEWEGTGIVVSVMAARCHAPLEQSSRDRLFEQLNGLP